MDKKTGKIITPALQFFKFKLSMKEKVLKRALIPAGS